MNNFSSFHQRDASQLNLYWLGSAPLPDPQSLRTESSPGVTSQNDPLIAHGWQKTSYIGAVLILLIILVIVGLVSKRIEHVIVTGLILSAILIVGLLVLAH